MLRRETLLLSFDLRGIIEGETGKLSAIPVGRPIEALTPGESAFFASIISPVSPEKVVVEPAFLQDLERDQKLGVSVGVKKANKFQVLIPIYNEEDVIEETFAEIERLGYLDVCVFIDDASKDRTPEILRKWEHKLAGVYYMRKNGAKIGSVKKVLEEMEKQGNLPEYVVLSDADTFFYNHETKRAFNNAIAFLEENGSKAIAIIDVPYKNHSLLQRLQVWEYLSDRAMHNILSRKGYMRCICGAGGIYSSRCLLEALKQHSLRHAGDDMETTCLVQKLGYKVGYYNNDLEARTRVPNTWKRLFKQRIRWTLGAMETYLKEWRFYLKQVSKINRYSWQILYETLKLITYSGWYIALFFYPILTFLIGWVATYALSLAFLLVNPESKGQRVKAIIWMIPTSWMIYFTDVVRVPTAYIKCLVSQAIGWDKRKKFRLAKCPKCKTFTPYKEWSWDVKTEEWTQLKISEIRCRNRGCETLVSIARHN